ncbi:MAG: tetratricopeptide repeat protein [Candidatus Thorarchaeota archaeon]
MKLSEMAEAIATKPRWAAGWLLTNSVLCGLTMIALSRWGPLPFDDTSAFLLGFFVPLVIYGIKEAMGLYKYPTNYANYHFSESMLEDALVHYENEKWSEALVILDHINKFLQGHKRVLYYSARCNEELGDHELASSQYREYLELQPDDSEIRDALSRVEMSLTNGAP